MKFRSLELKVGVTVVAALFILIAGLMWFEGVKIGRESYQIFATFPIVGGISPGDAVNVNGVERGEVNSVKLLREGVDVGMRIDTGTFIPEDSKVILQSHGLLGERMILIVRGVSEKAVQEGATLEGVYKPGISETFSSLSDVMDGLNDISEDIGKISRILTDEGKLKRSIDNLAVITDQLRDLISETSPDFKKSTEAFKSSSMRIDSMLGRNSEKIERIIAGLDTTMGRMPVVVGRVDTLTTLLVDISKRLKSSESTAGTLLNDREFIERLQSTVIELEKLIADIKKNPGKYLKLEIF
ncbi:MAG TPA: MlaD family protein [Candidatus Krumholzibacteriaceae bacterium]|nr:MlaD family protein [Candidatus Krumholzibacteriaceae bacterium]